MLAHAIVDTLKSLYGTNTHIHINSILSRLSFWAEAVWKYLSAVIFHFKLSFTCCYNNKPGLLDHSTGANGWELLWLALWYLLYCYNVWTCFQACCVMFSCLWWWQCAAAAEVKQLAVVVGKDRESVCLADTWVARPVESLSESHPGTVDVGPGLSAARVPAGVRLWTSN